MSKELLRDGLHLTPKGYQIWADNMNPYLLDILNNDGKGDIWTKNSARINNAKQALYSGKS